MTREMPSLQFWLFKEKRIFFVVVKIGFLESNLAEVLNECSFSFYTYLLTQSFTSKKVFL